MYHVELRQFPHNFCRFNLTEGELRETILETWVQGGWIELGERKWNPHQAKLTVLEGPHLPVEQLSMGRGWRNAVRSSEDVTERVTVAARGTLEPSPDSPRASPPATTKAGPAVEALVLELLKQLGDDPVPLVRAWLLALERHPDRTPSECLALAEGFLRG
jgi:hypothetical protein